MAEPAAILATVATGTDTEWLVRELEDAGVDLIDRRPRREGEGLLIAPFSSDREIAEILSSIYEDWEAHLELVHLGERRTLQLLR